MFSPRADCLYNSISISFTSKGWRGVRLPCLFFIQDLKYRNGTQCWMACRKQDVFAFIDRALDILEEINLSVSRKNKFSEAAYNKLLNNNLPLKYSQIGYLSSNNIISDGFYDYGRVSGCTYLHFSLLIIFPLIMMLLYCHFIKILYLYR